jgi:hypothetical protein
MQATTSRLLFGDGRWERRQETKVQESSKTKSSEQERVSPTAKSGEAARPQRLARQPKEEAATVQRSRRLGVPRRGGSHRDIHSTRTSTHEAKGIVQGRPIVQTTKPNPPKNNQPESGGFDSSCMLAINRHVFILPLSLVLRHVALFVPHRQCELARPPTFHFFHGSSFPVAIDEPL